MKPNSRLSSFERLEIYNRSYWSRVLEAFSEDFPGVRALLGARRFDRLRRRYLADCPSESFTMRDLGKNLAGVDGAQSGAGRAALRVALDMAKLEWAEIESFDAAEHERLEPRRCCRSRRPAARCRLQPHLRLIEAGHEVDTLLLEVRESAKRKGGAPRDDHRTRGSRARNVRRTPVVPGDPSL